MIDINTALQTLYNTIQFGLVHQDYNRTIEVAKFARQIVTGQGQDELIVRYKDRETAQQKEQRVRLTNTLTKYAANQIRTLSRRIDRTDGVKSILEHDNTASLEKIQPAVKRFYGDKSLEDYIKDRQLFYSFVDPNAIILVERRDERGLQNEILKTTPYPLEIDSVDVLNLGRDKGNLDWVIFRQNRIETQLERDQYGAVTGIVEERLTDYYFYQESTSISLTEFKNVVPKIDQEKQSKLVINAKTGGERNFVQEIHDKTGSKEFPLVVCGYLKDDTTKGRTYVTPLDPAEEIFRDLIQIKSEFDLTRTLHTFLQKIAYAPRCEHEHPEYGQCEQGYYGGDPGRECQSCSGRGVDVHTTAQDVIFVALPDNKEAFFPLQDLVHYVNMPDWLPKWQFNELLETTLRRVSLAILQTELFETAKIENTATAKVVEFDKLNDFFVPLGQAISEKYKKCVRIVAQYLEVDEGLKVEHSYSKDFKLKDIQTLITEFGAAKQNGVSTESLWAIEVDLLSKQYVNDPAQLELIKVKQSFKPFRDKTPEEIVFILSGRDNEDPDKILYENFSRIFFEIEKEQEQPFHSVGYNRQKEVLQEKIAQVAKGIKFRGNTEILNPLNLQDDEQEPSI